MRINVSFHIMLIDAFSIIALMMMMNHFAGIILLITCNGSGMLESGNMKPDRMITGSINPIREIIIAVCCELEIVEINIPNERAVIMKSMLESE
jgi:hypothetical protein